jgi:hypothetical protein
MMTLVSLICILTMFFWLRIWDKAIKKKVKIIELLPRENENVKWALIAIPTGITFSVILYLIVSYLP